MHAPDPIVTASIFCNRRLDRVVHGVMAPALARLRAEHPGEWGAWWVRYARNGDHLKVRIHGPAGHADDARRILHESADALFAALPPLDEAEERILRPSSPPIDAEDEGSDAFPDRSVLWTTYRRSHVSLGPKALLRDDAYVARVTACLAAGADVVLQATALDENGAIPAAGRQRAVLRAVLGGVRAAGFGPGERAAYVAYHRDWLVRYNTLDEEGENRVRGGFGKQLDRMGATVAGLARAAAAQWSAAGPPADATDARWHAAVAELRAWSEGLRGTLSPDPYTDEPGYPLLFKAFHGVANQAGLDMMNEGFVHHLLVAVAEAVDDPVETAGTADGETANAGTVGGGAAKVAAEAYA